MFILIPCFSEIPNMFICVRVRQVAFLCEDWKKLSVWSSALFTVFTLEICEGEAYTKQTGSNLSVLLSKVSTLVHYRFMRVSTLAHDYSQILIPIISLVD